MASLKVIASVVDAGGERAAGERRRGAGHGREDDADVVVSLAVSLEVLFLAAAGNGGRVRNAGRGVLGDAHGQRQRRIAAPAASRSLRVAVSVERFTVQPVPLKRRGRQSRRQRVDQAHRAAGRPRRRRWSR